MNEFDKKKRGCFVSNEYHYVASYNMIFRHDDYTAVEMFKIMSMLCPIDAEEVLCGHRHILTHRWFDRLLSFICRIESPWFKHMAVKQMESKRKIPD